MTPEERSELIADIVLALAAAPKKELTAEELDWVRLAIAAGIVTGKQFSSNQSFLFGL